MRHQPRRPDGVAIERLRFERGLGRYELGRLAGLHGGIIGRIERGERIGRPDTIRKIATALGVPVEAITRIDRPATATPAA